MTHRFRPVLRRLGGIAFCLLLLLVGISLRWEVRWQSSSGQHYITLRNGAVYHINRAYLSDGFPLPKSPWAGPPSGGWASSAGWEVRDSRGGLDFWGRDRSLTGKPGVVSTSYPLAPILLVIGVLTGVSWWRETTCKPKHEHCQRCGYDLTGNVSGVCPECGVRRQNRQGAVDERAIR